MASTEAAGGAQQAAAGDMAALEQVFAHLSEPPAAVARGRGRHATLLVFNHVAIPLTEEGYGDSWTVVPLTVVSVQDPGFARVPYSKTMGKGKGPAPVTKPLGELVQHADAEGARRTQALRLYSFQKASMAKGERVDDVFVDVEPGNVFKIFMDVNKFKQMAAVSDAAQHLLPRPPPGGAAVLPPYSLLEMAVSAKNHENASERFSMVNIQTLRPVTGASLHTVHPLLQLLPASADAALAAARDCVSASPYMERDLERELVSFFVPCCATDAAVEEVDVGGAAYVRVTGFAPPGSEADAAADAAVDLPAAEVLRLTNSVELGHALNLLTVAFALEAVALVVVRDSFWERGGGSALRGAALVRADRVFARALAARPWEAAEGGARMLLGAAYDDGEGAQPLELVVGPAAQFAAGFEPPYKVAPTADFPLVLPGHAAADAHVCCVNLQAANGRAAVPHVVKFACVPGAPRRGAGGKRKLQSMSWSA